MEFHCAAANGVDILLFLFAINAHLLESAATKNVILSHVLFRHGDRTPMVTYPTDPHRDYWNSLGFQKMTNAGKRQVHQLGSFIRQRYSNFLNSLYNTSEVLVNSSDTDRTLMSSYSLLAGLYPPDGEQVWNDTIMWQPIPVHTKPLHTDYFLSDHPFCPSYVDELHAIYASPKNKAIEEKNKDFYALITKNSGIHVNNISHLNLVSDAVHVEMLHNMTIPEWARPIYKQMIYLVNLRLSLVFSTTKSQRLRGGPLLGHMINNIQSRISGTNMDRKLFLFASHDFSISAFMMALKVFNNKIPPLSCAIFVDLLETSPGEYAVEIHYRNDSSVDPYLLIIPNCTSPCRFDDFLRLTRDVISEDILEECGANSGFIGQLSYTIGILLICETFLVVFCMVCCIVCWNRQKNLEYRYSMVLND